MIQDGWIMSQVTCQNGCWRPDTRQPLPLVSEAPAGLGGPSRGLLLPAAQAGTQHTGPPGETAPGDNEPSTLPGGIEDTSDLYILKDNFTDTCAEDTQKRIAENPPSPTHLSTAAGHGGKEEEEMQRGTVGQIKLEAAEDFALHSQQLMLSVGVVH